MKLEDVMLREINQSQKGKYCMIHLYEVFGGGNVIETERTVLARAWGMGSCYSMGTESRFCKMRKFWRWVHSNVSVLNTTQLYT